MAKDEAVDQRISAMRAGGKTLAQIRTKLRQEAKPGVSFESLEAVAQQEIARFGMKPSFSTVPGYSWATCIMKNHELCHGLPKEKVIASGDVITIDVGLLNQGYHLDTTTSFAIGNVSPKVSNFLAGGRRILDKALARARAGVSVYEISQVFERQLAKHGWGAVSQLTGHGIGRRLHEEPAIPCVARPGDRQVKLQVGQTLAIEIMYTLGNPSLELASDGWTYQTADGQLSAMFEETVLVKAGGPPEILTRDDGSATFDSINLN